MKKHVFLTIGTILGISSLVSFGVLIPAAKSAISPSLLIINNANSLYNGKNTSVGFKEAVLGTKAINNGNYVLYFGSQSIESNLKFLYNVPKDSNWSDFLNILASNSIVDIDGDFWNSINYIKNTSEKPWVNLKNKPQFVSYIHRVNEESTLRKEEFKDSLQNYLNQILKIASNYSNLSKKEQNKYDQMLNYIRQNTNGKAGPRSLPSSIIDFNTEENKVNPKWTISIENLTTWSYSPFAKYSDLNNKQLFFNNDNDSVEFRNLWTFVQSRFNDVKDISNSEGLILGFKNGVLTKKYSLSFEPESSTPPSEENKPTNTSFINENKKATKLYANQKSNVSKPSSTFYNWLEEVYGK